MPSTKVNDKLLVWASELDEGTIAQAERTARLPIVAGHVALMPDAHIGIGATVGSVVPTEGAILPGAVGVDIGCGMAAVRTDLVASDLPDSLDPLLDRIERAIPAGVGKGHSSRSDRAQLWLDEFQPRTELTDKQRRKAAEQFGTLGSGNHFVEISLDEQERVWAVLHSGSRGIGNELATMHITKAKKVAKRAEIGLEDPDLAYYLEGTPEFEHYVADLLWAQRYALENRQVMLDALLTELFRFVGKGRERERVQCHHNYAAQEEWHGKRLWITRKGAIRAGVGERGIIPGSMGTDTFIVEGLGNPDSFASCAHGAGRRLSRGAAKRQLTVQSLHERMTGKTWLSKSAAALLDEHPDAYKDIEQVMRDQADLVRIVHRLSAIANYKGT